MVSTYTHTPTNDCATTLYIYLALPAQSNLFDQNSIVPVEWLSLDYKLDNTPLQWIIIRNRISHFIYMFI